MSLKILYNAYVETDATPNTWREPRSLEINAEHLNIGDVVEIDNYPNLYAVIRKSGNAVFLCEIQPPPVKLTFFGQIKTWLGIEK